MVAFLVFCLLLVFVMSTQNVSGSERSALAKKLNLTKSVSTSTPLIAQLASGGSSSSVLSDVGDL